MLTYVISAAFSQDYTQLNEFLLVFYLQIIVVTVLCTYFNFIEV